MNGCFLLGNLSSRLSIDETALSNGELYTIITNKEAKGRKGAIVAMIKGTVAEDIIGVLKKIPERSRKRVQEVTMDMAANMQLAIKRCFVNAHRVIDRFHVQKLAYDAVQECRIKYRWAALDLENQAIAQARKDKAGYQPEVLLTEIRSNNYLPEADTCFSNTIQNGQPHKANVLNYCLNDIRN